MLLEWLLLTFKTMNGYLIKINSLDLTPYLKKYSVARPKLFADAGRNMRGNLKNTFLGVFPKITLEFRPINETEADTILTVLEGSIFTVEWYDAVTRGYKTGDFYPGDYDYSILLKDRGIYDSFKVSLITYNAME